MNIKRVYAIVVAILVISVCCITGYNYGYNISPCDAIDISLTDARVVAFLDRTDMATVNVYNCEYIGYNTWLVCWHTKTQSQRVYVDVVTGQIIGTGPEPGPCWHTVTVFRGRHQKQTAAFNVKGDMWRINWKTAGMANDSAISVYVHEQWNFIPIVDSFSQNTFPFNSGTYCIFEGPEKYFLDVRPTHLEYWEIEVEDYY